MKKNIFAVACAIALFINVNIALAQKDSIQSSPPVSKNVVGYVSFIIPAVNFFYKQSGSNADFTNGTTKIGFPVGINVFYNEKFGFSYEITPTIKVSGNTSKMSNLVFDPGTMFRFKHGFMIITRLAFETSGRYGFTPVFNKVIMRTKDVIYAISLSLPVRFGEDNGITTPASVGGNVQFIFMFK